MPVTLEQSKQNATEAYDPAVIDEFRKSSFLMDQLTFDDVVSPAGGGATLDYGYRRLNTQPTANFRAINSEYTPTEVTTSKHSVELKVLGGSFQIDRVLAKIGPAASGEVNLQMSQKIKAAKTKFADAVVNGDGATEAESFDGLSKALAGSTTEFNVAGQAGADWAAVSERAAGIAALKHLRKMVSKMDGAPSAFLMNADALATLQGIAEFVSQLGELSAFGQTISTWRGIPLVDLGEKPGTSDPVIPTSQAVGAEGTTSIYAVRMGLDGFHGVSTLGGQLVQSWMPDFTKSGAVKTGEVEMGPVAVALKATKAAAVLRGVKVA